MAAELAVQHALLSRGLLTAVVEGVSTINFPIPSALFVATVAVLLVVRRWFDLLVTLLVALADGSSAIIKVLVHRPRPAGYGIQVLQHLLGHLRHPALSNLPGALPGGLGLGGAPS